MAEIPWKQLSRDAYGVNAAAATTGRFEPPQKPGRVSLSAICSRCQHNTTSTEVLEVQPAAVDETAARELHAGAIATTVAVDCLCDRKHRGRPRAMRRGCGARWALAVSGPVDASGTAAVEAGRLAEAPTPEDEAALAALITQQLGHARKTAENWRTGLLLLAGLVTTFAIVKGTEDIAKLSDPWPIVLALLAASALIAAVVGALFSLAASFGVPGTTIAVRHGLEQELADWRQDEARRSGDRIRVAAVLAVVSVALLAAAVGVTWFAGTEPPAYLQIGAEPGAVCGKVKESDETSVTITDAANVDHEVALSAVRSLAVVGECQ